MHVYSFWFGVGVLPRDGEEADGRRGNENKKKRKRRKTTEAKRRDPQTPKFDLLLCFFDCLSIHLHCNWLAGTQKGESCSLHMARWQPPGTRLRSAPPQVQRDQEHRSLPADTPRGCGSTRGIRSTLPWTSGGAEWHSSSRLFVARTLQLMVSLRATAITQTVSLPLSASTSLPTYTTLHCNPAPTPA